MKFFISQMPNGSDEAARKSEVVRSEFEPTEANVELVDRDEKHRHRQSGRKEDAQQKRPAERDVPPCQRVRRERGQHRRDQRRHPREVQAVVERMQPPRGDDLVEVLARRDAAGA